MKKKETRKRFSFLLFFITSLLLLLFSAGVSIGYFYYVGKSRIKEIEDYTRDYSITLADAFTNVAELSYNRRNYSKLKILFQEKINKNIIDEAFFVLADGKIIAHTDKKTTKSLKGNIATDEFAYNLDLILYPLRIKSKQAQFFDYHIFNKEIPFSKDFKRIIKTYLYKKIDIVGWLITKAVYSKRRGVGCISLIISKDRIYNFLQNHIDYTLRRLTIFSVISIVIALLISIVASLGYKTPKLRDVKVRMPEFLPGEVSEEYGLGKDLFVMGQITKVNGSSRQNIPVRKIDKLSDKPIEESDHSNITTKVIKNAIPIIHK